MACAPATPATAAAPFRTDRRDASTPLSAVLQSSSDAEITFGVSELSFMIEYLLIKSRLLTTLQTINGYANLFCG
jgi:hypothetical protein